MCEGHDSGDPQHRGHAKADLRRSERGRRRHYYGVRSLRLRMDCQGRCR